MKNFRFIFENNENDNLRNSSFKKISEPGKMQFSKRLKMGFFKFIFPFSKSKNKEKRIEMHSRIQFSLICDLGIKIRRSCNACICCKHA